MRDNAPLTTSIKKEVVPSLLMLAPQGSLDLRQIRGHLSFREDGEDDDEDVKPSPPPSLESSIPSPPSDDESEDPPPPTSSSSLSSSSDAFAKKSKKVQKSHHLQNISSDGDCDLWVEARIVVDKQTGRTRSYFYSKRTQRRVWDEPPSGASRVIYMKDMKRVYVRETRHCWGQENVVKQDEEEDGKRNLVVDTLKKATQSKKKTGRGGKIRTAAKRQVPVTGRAFSPKRDTIKEEEGEEDKPRRSRTPPPSFRYNNTKKGSKPKRTLSPFRGRVGTAAK